MTGALELPPSVLVADIGGTNARFAVADPATLDLSAVTQFRCAEHPSLGTAAFSYLRAMQPRPRYAAIAVAAPVIGEDIKLTNSPWSFARGEVCDAAGLDGLLVLNDFQALALSLPYLAGEDLQQIGGAKVPRLATKAVLGPGTGIGVAGLVWGGSDWVALPSEGGHISLAARSQAEFDLVERLGAHRDRVSVERALSGPGIADLYLAIAATRGREIEPLIPNDVLERGLDGSDEIAAEALRLFVTWFGAFAGDVALLFGARGGIYLGGGIAPKIVTALAAGPFRAAFEDKGRMRGFVTPIPVNVITAPFAALKGAAAGLRASLLKGGAGLSVPSR
jgi:glucokinase